MAISVSVTSTKIDVTSTGGSWETLDAICTAIGDTAVMERTGSGPYVYTIKAATYREFEISSGCKVRFEANDELRWTYGTITTTTYVLDFASGSEIDVEEGFVFDLQYSQVSGTFYPYISSYGKVDVTGVDGNPVIFKNYRSLYMSAYQENNWDWFELKDNLYSTGYFMSFTQYSASYGPEMNFSNFKIYNTSGNNGYGFYFNPGGMYANVNITDFEIDGAGYGALFYGSSSKLSNGTIKNCSGPAIYAQGTGNVVSAGYETSKDDTTFPTGRFQSMGVVENVHFIDNDAGVYSVYASANSLLQVKDCTFEGQTYSGTQDGIYALYGSVILEYNNTFTNIDVPRIWAANGTFLHTRKFDITVKDLAGDPIEDAIVSWVQGSAVSKERWAGVTDSDGHILNVFGGSPVFVEKEETSASTYEQWSNDTASGLCLNLTVTKYGYQVEQAQYEMTEDKDIIVTLTPLGAGATTLYDTTLYDATIY